MNLEKKTFSNSPMIDLEHNNRKHTTSSVQYGVKFVGKKISLDVI